jgi:hypothetical protein
LTAATTAPVDVCVGVQALQASTERGQAAAWVVGAWTTGGNVPDVKLQLQTTPAAAGTAVFTFGCGTKNGTSACDLGAVDAASAVRQLQAQVTVPVTAATVTSASLTVTGSAATLGTDPTAAAAVTILTPPTPVGATSTTSTGNLPGVTAPIVSPSLSPGGNAATLFPSLDPQSSASSSPGTGGATVPLANNSVRTAGSNTLAAQVVGLLALALAAAFAVTRISIRRPTPSRPAGTAAAAPPPQAPAKTSEPGQPGKEADKPPSA